MSEDKITTIKEVQISVTLHKEKGLIISAKFDEGVQVSVVSGELIFRFEKTANKSFSSANSSPAWIAFCKSEVKIIANLLLVYNKHTHEGGDLQSLLEEHFFDS